MKYFLRSFIPVLIYLVLCLSCTVFGAGSYKNQWVEKKGDFFFYDASGKKVKGLTVIQKKKYYFDDGGVQRTGWRQIDKDYYFFRNKSGRRGYMLTDTTVNGIRLKKNGKAKSQDKAIRKKLKVLVTYASWVDELTKSSMSKKKKLKVCFDYLRRNFYYRTLGQPEWDDRWDVKEAAMLSKVRKLKRPYYNCYMIASGFAYMANAIGYKDVVIYANSMHGWVEIGGKIYDVSQSRVHLDWYGLFGASARTSFMGTVSRTKAL